MLTNTMTYTTYWHRFPRGIEGEPTHSQYKEFSNLGDAIKFAQRKYEKTRGIYFAAAHVEDADGNWLFDITDGGVETYHTQKEEVSC